MTEYQSGFDAEGVKRDAGIAEEPGSEPIYVWHDADEFSRGRYEVRKGTRDQLREKRGDLIAHCWTMEDAAICAAAFRVRSEGGGEKPKCGGGCVLNAGHKTGCFAPIDGEPAPSGEKGWQQKADFAWSSMVDEAWQQGAEAMREAAMLAVQEAFDLIGTGRWPAKTERQMLDAIRAIAIPEEK
jgi:hypothetical protein